MKYIFWDIDGTLLLTGGAGGYAMIDVIKFKVFQKVVLFDYVNHSVTACTTS